MFSFIHKKSHKSYRSLVSRSRGLSCWVAAAAAKRGIVTECRRHAALGLAARFMRDRSGAYAAMFGLMAPIFIGTLALGSETGLWYSTQEKMQGAADSSAISAAVGLIGGDTNVTLEANATAASDGFVNGSNGSVVTVNKPPLSGPNVGTPGAVEVIIKQPQNLLFSSLFLKAPVVVRARAVAGPTPEVVCVLALGKLPVLPSVLGIAAAAGANVLADQCNVADNATSPLALTSALATTITAQKVDVVGGIVNVLGTITTTQGTHTGVAAKSDPFAGLSVPASFSSLPCNSESHYNTTTHTTHTVTGTVTLSPGRYCGGLTIGAGGSVTLSPGTYYMDGSTLFGLLSPGLVVATGGSVTGTGVTIVLTSSNGVFSNLANVDFGGLVSGGVINLTAPSSGPFANLVVFVDPGALLSVVTFRGGTQNNFVGTIYAPSSLVTYALGSGTKTGQCTRLIGDTISFGLTGASFSKCAVTLGPSSRAPASLLE
jgi:Putative Flp pilus-assembly TadE/G-like